MARKAAKNQPALIPDALDAAPAAKLRPLPSSVQELFLPDLVDSAVNNQQFDKYKARVQSAHAVFLQWIDKLRSGLLRDLSETQVEQDFTSHLLKELGYLSQGSVLAGQPWSIQTKWTITNVGQADLVLGRITHDETAGLAADILAVGELKGAKIDLDRKDATGRSPIQQAFDYLNGCPSARWALVTNYAEFRLYHREKGYNSVHRVLLEDLADPAQFARFFAVFHADSLISDTALTWNAAKLLSATNERQEKVGRELYDHYDKQRYRLIQLLQSEHKLDKDNAITKAQKLLDRVLFVAFADDRRLLDDRRVLEKTFELKVPMRSAWNNFQALFRAFDEGDLRSGITRFDGSLFEKDPLLDSPDFHLDDTWPQVFDQIGQFDFKNEVSVEVLGRIFERSITDLEKLKAGDTAAYEEQIRDRKAPGRRKREGVYYTDKPIVDYLVNAALEPQWLSRKAELDQQHGIDPNAVEHPPAAHSRALLAWLDALKVCDPACGSGAFLIGAYQWFEVHRMGLLDMLDAVDPDASECSGGREDWRARSAEQILKHNLYGVDLAAESIEIARLSLWIQTARRGQLLTDLRHNVVQGNSVVDDENVDSNHAFDWQAKFPEVFVQGGFDAVIGNPPYVRQERLKSFKRHWEVSFPEAYESTADLYVYFFARGLDLLRGGGFLSFICSNSFARAGFGEKLRGLIQKSTSIRQFIDLGDTGLFKDAKDVYPALVVLQRQEPTEDDTILTASFRKTDDPTQVDSIVEQRSIRIPQSDLRSSGWRFEGSEVARLREKITASSVRLESYLQSPMLLGVKSALNEAFMIDAELRDLIIREHPPSAELLKPARGGEHLRRWHVEDSHEWLIVITNGTTSKSGPFSDESSAWDWFARTYPPIAEHLKHFEKKARNRQDKGEYWWELRPCDYYDAFEKPKILYPDIAKSARFSLDRSGIYISNTGYMIPTDDEALLGILNSKIIWFALSGISIPFGERAGESRYRMFSHYLRRLPIPILPDLERAKITELSRLAAERSRDRYQILGRVLHRMTDSFRKQPHGRNKPTLRLQAWADSTFQEIGVELRKSFGLTDSPWIKPKLADEWEPYLDEQTAHVRTLTDQIRDTEAELNHRVYHLFGLSKAEIGFIEEQVVS